MTELLIKQFDATLYIGVGFFGRCNFFFVTFQKYADGCVLRLGGRNENAFLHLDLNLPSPALGTGFSGEVFGDGAVTLFANLCPVGTLRCLCYGCHAGRPSVANQMSEWRAHDITIKPQAKIDGLQSAPKRGYLLVLKGDCPDIAPMGREEDGPP